MMSDNAKKVIFVDDKMRDLGGMLLAVINIAVLNSEKLAPSSPLEIDFLHVRWKGNKEKDKLDEFEKIKKELSSKLTGKYEKMVSICDYHSCELEEVADAEEYKASVEGWVNEVQKKLSDIIRNSPQYVILLDVCLYSDFRIDAKVFETDINSALSMKIRQKHEAACVAYTSYIDGTIQDKWKQATKRIPYERDTDLWCYVSLDVQKDILERLG